MPTPALREDRKLGAPLKESVDRSSRERPQSTKTSKNAPSHTVILERIHPECLTRSVPPSFVNQLVHGVTRERLIKS